MPVGNFNYTSDGYTLPSKNSTQFLNALHVLVNYLHKQKYSKQELTDMLNVIEEYAANLNWQFSPIPSYNADQIREILKIFSNFIRNKFPYEKDDISWSLSVIKDIISYKWHICLR
jgi:myosin heavy subunit